MGKAELIEMKEFFDCYDDSFTGKINNSDIEKIMNILGEFPSSEEINQIVKEIDYDQDGVVDFDEFTCLMVKHMAHQDSTLEEELETVFKRFDADGDGLIGPEDLLNIMQEIGHNTSIEEAEIMLTACFGVTGEGQLKFQQFVQFMMYDTLDQDLFNQLEKKKRSGEVILDAQDDEDGEDENI